MCPHTTPICVSSYYCIRVLILLLYMCPHATIYVSREAGRRRMLTYADVCSRMLAYAHVCSYMCPERLGAEEAHEAQCAEKKEKKGKKEKKEEKEEKEGASVGETC